MYDAIIIGAGVGGLACASKLASKGKKVLVLERMYHLGGSSAVFKREDFTFPMGPLSFSHPDLVKMMLKDVGISEDIQFKRSHFQLHQSLLTLREYSLQEIHHEPFVQSHHSQ